MQHSTSENLITTKKAGELFGYTPDYLARLARSGKISGTRVGHTWLVDEESIKRFFVENQEQKINRTRALSDMREREYRAHRSVGGRINKALKRSCSPARNPMVRVDTVSHVLRTQFLAGSVACMVLVFGVLGARASVLPSVMRGIASVGEDVASGFKVSFKTTPRHVVSEFSRVRAAMWMHAPYRSLTHEGGGSSAYPPQELTIADVTRLQAALSRGYAGSSHPSAVARGMHQTGPVMTIEGLWETLRTTHLMLTDIPRTTGALADEYRALGKKGYALIASIFSHYTGMINQFGARTLSGAVVVRDFAAGSPDLIARANLALGESVISVTHRAIGADVSLAYGVAVVAPESARVAAGFVNGLGEGLVRATHKVPGHLATLFLRASALPATVAPGLARAVFDTEYAGATHFVGLTNEVANRYLAAVDGTGRVAYTGARGVAALAGTIKPTIARAPTVIEDAYLGVLGRTALALSALSKVSVVETVGASLRDTAAPMLAAAEPALSAGQRAALTTYRAIHNLFNSTTDSLAVFFVPPAPNLIQKVASVKKVTVATSSPSRAVPVALTSYPTYTTIVKGVSQDSVDQSLAALRGDVLATVARMIQPVAAQTATNVTTIQQVNMIQNLSDLIVHNGSFRGGTFDGGSVTNGIAVTAVTGRFENLIAGDTALGTTTVTGPLVVNGVTITSNGGGGGSNNGQAAFFTATSSTASTFPYASTTALTVSGVNGLSLGSLNGPLQANGGAVSATTSVGVLYGGTGLSLAPAYGQVLLGNSSGGYTLTATSSLGINSGVWGAITGTLSAQTDLQNAFDAKFGLASWYATTSAPQITTLANLIYATTTNLNIGSTITGAGLASCSNSTSKLLWNSATQQFTCGVDAGSSGGLTGLGAEYSPYQTGSTQTLATSSDANIGLVITSGADTHTFTPQWIGTLGDSRITSASTWNAKQNAISVTWPITLSGATIGFNGLSTSTAAVIGNIPYFSGVNTFANVATTTSTLGSEFSYTGTFGSLVGGISGTLSLATNATPLNKLVQIGANTLLGNVTGSTGNVTAISTSTLNIGGTAGNVTGIVAVANGGTGLASFAPNSILYSDNGGTGLAFAATSSLFGFVPVSNALAKGNFLVGNDAGTAQATSSIFVSSLGLIGVGSTTPSNLFSVQGNSYYSGTAFFGGAITATSTLNVTGLTTLGNASTTQLSVSGTASTTSLVISGLGNGSAQCLQVDAAGVVSAIGSACGTGSGSVNSVANSDSTLTISPTTGSVVASLNLAHPNTWTGLQQFNSNASTTQLTVTGATYLATAGGVVGIGTTSPWGLLAVNPDNIAGPAFVIGSSTATKFIVTNGGYVGIGTNAPNSPLHINYNNSAQYIGDQTNSNVYTQYNTRGIFGYNGTSGNAVVQGGSGKGIEFNVNSATPGSGTVAVITSGGSLGIGTTSPFSALSVSTTTASAPSTSLFAVASSTNATLFNILGGGKVGLGTTTPWAQLSVNSDALGSGVPEFAIGSSSATHFIVTGAGKVGIGTTSPFAALSATAPSNTGGTSIALYGAPATSATGGAILIKGGSATSGNGGDVSVSGGAQSGSSSGGASLVLGGGSAVGPDATLTAGSSGGGGGGNVNINGGSGNFSGNQTGGSVVIYGGAGNSGYNAGSVFLNGGSATASGGVSGNVILANVRGFVGVGTTSPLSVLSVSTTTASAPSTSLFAVASSTNATLFNILGGGKVGLGTTTPWAGLSVNPNALGSGIPEFAIGSSSATHFIVTGAGKVGIGTLTPTQLLEVNGSKIALTGTQSTGTITIGGTDTGGSGTVNVGYGQAVGYSSVAFGYSNSQTSGLVSAGITLGISNSLTGDGSVAVGNANSAAQNGVALGTSNAAPFGGVAIGRGINNTIASSLQIGPSDTAKITVLSSGLVGIGTTSPLGKLDVSGSSASTDLVTFDPSRSVSVINTDTTTGNAQGIVLRSISTNGTTQSGVKLLAVNTARSAAGLTSDFAILTNNDGSISEKMRVLSSGRVGLGTTTPWAQLSVNPNALGSGVPEFAIGSSSATHFIVTGAGNVGINNTTPQGKLDISTASGDGVYLDESGGAGSVSFNVYGSVGHLYFRPKTEYAVFQSAVSSNSTMQIQNSGGYSQVRFYGSNDNRIITNSGDLTITPSANTNISQGRVGLASTTPWAQLSVNPNALGSGVPEFAIGSSSATHLLVTGAGYLGLGTTTPGSLLSIQGIANFTTATSTLYGNGINLTNGCFAVGGVCVGGGSGTNYFTNSGNLTYLSTGSNLGIGTTSPFSALSVSTTTASAPSTSLFAVASSTNATLFNVLGSGLVGLGTTTPWAQLSVNPDALGSGVPEFAIGSSSATHFIVTGAGKVGIGTTSPYGSLSVNGLIAGANVNADSASATSTFAGNISVGGGFDLKGGRMMDSNLASPVFLDVKYDTVFGQGAFTGGLGNDVNATAIGYFAMHNGLNGDSVAVGNSAMRNAGSGTGNVAVGNSSLYSNQGVGNNAFGYQSLYSTTAGFYNIGVGYQAGYNTTTGYDNIMIGHVADTGGNNITTGGNNILLGYNAALGNTTSSSNFLNIGNSFFGNLVATSTSTSLPTDYSQVAFGIGSSSPWAMLSVNPTAGMVGPAFAIGSSSATNFVVTNGGNVGVGTAVPTSRLDLVTSATSSAAITLRDTLGGIALELRASTSTLQNTYLGVDAGLVTTSGGSNTAVGYQNLYTNTSGQQNTAIGYQTLYTNANGASNTGAGFKALYTNGSGGSNTASGYSALYSNSSGSNNTASGYSALYNNTTGSNNTAAGYKALYGQFSGFYNIGIGYQAGYNISSGYDNIMIGDIANTGGNNITTGRNNIGLGYNAGIGTSTSATNFLNIGNSFFGTMVATSSSTSLPTSFSNVAFGIGSSSPWGMLSVNPTVGMTGPAFAIGSSTATNFVVLNSGLAGLGTTTPWAQLSVNPNALGSGIPEFAIGSSSVTHLVVTGAGNLGIGTSSPLAKLDVAGGNNATSPLFQLSSVASFATTTQLIVTNSGFLGLASTTPWAQLSVNPNALGSGVPEFAIGSSSALHLIVTGAGYLGLGTTTPYAQLSVANLIAGANFNADNASATSTFAGGLNVGAGNLTYNFSTGETAIGGLLAGTQSFDTDAGMVQWTDLPIASSFVYTPESYTASIGGNPMILVYGQSDGVSTTINNGVSIGSSTPPSAVFSVFGRSSTGSTTVEFANSASTTLFKLLDNGRAGFGTTSPFAALSIATTSTATVPTLPLFAVASSTNATLFNILGGGKVGLGTTTPWAQLSVNSDALGSGVPEFAVGSTSASHLLVTGAGNVGIGTTTPDMLLAVGSATPTGSVAHFENSTGSCYINPTTTALTCTSDARLKTNVNALSDASGLDALSQLRPVTYNWKGGETAGAPTHTGFIAQEVQAVMPDLVAQAPDGYLTMNYAGLTPYLVKGVQELDARFNATGSVASASSSEVLPADVLTADGKSIDLYKLATFALARAQSLGDKVDAQDLRLTSLESRVDALESGAISSASGSPLTLSTSTLASALSGFGILIEKGIAQFNTLVFRQLVASKDADGTSSAGSVTILTGNTVAQVNNSLVKTSTKVFVTFNTQVAGTWWVSDKTDGSFRVVLSAAQTADVSFDYFLVQTEGQIATSTPLTVSQSSGPDTVAPTITLLGDNPLHLSVGAAFADPGVTVTDAVDGTDPLVTYVNGVQQEVSSATIDTSSPTTYLITYQATDRAGNTAVTRRSVIVGNPDGTVAAPAPDAGTTIPSDTTPPVVTLIGSAAVSLTQGDAFTDPGATATDDTDGDLTAKVVVSGTVDTATAGVYTLTYSATDAAGNTGTASRLVTVAPAPAPAPAASPAASSTPATL